MTARPEFEHNPYDRQNCHIEIILTQFPAYSDFVDLVLPLHTN
jgi:hypothetical protein